VLVNAFARKFLYVDNKRRNLNRNRNLVKPGASKGGDRMPTRAEALMHLLQSAGCPESELATLKNTVANQEVPEMKEV
jgi:site-specific recombinase XerD